MAEIERFCEGAVWRMQRQAQFDYSLADLIGISVARIMDSKVEFPDLYKVYPYLFEKEEQERLKQEKEEEIRMTNSMNNFLAQAMRINAMKRKGVENVNDDD